MKDAVTSLANLVSAFKAQPSEDPLPWNDRNELQDLFGLFCSRYEADKQEVLQKVRPAAAAVKPDTRFHRLGACEVNSGCLHIYDTRSYPSVEV